MAARAMRNETRYEKLSTLQNAAARNDYTQTVGTVYDRDKRGAEQPTASTLRKEHQEVAISLA
jgi:hypothetical protein